MRLFRITIIILCLSLPIFAADEPNSTAAITDVNTIVNKANLAAYYQGDDGKAKVDMTITNRQGQTRQREFIILRKDIQDGGDQKYFVYFLKPADVRKMVYMVHKHTQLQTDDDRWLYMPALDLVKRIAAGDKRTSFVGSDFLYEDVSGRSLEEDTHELIDAGERFFVVKNMPKNPDTVEFSHYTVAIDRKNFVPMKMDFYDKQGKLYRVIESEKVEIIQNFPTVVKSSVTDLKTGSKTEMEFNDVKYDIGLDEDIFTERYLRRPPREAIR
jgi:outer membrane lipoprotein-sorting protein